MTEIFNEAQSMSALFDLFLDQQPTEYEIKSTSRGDEDFREAIIVKYNSKEKYVIKLADNDFTYPSKIAEWKTCSEGYRRLSYYCPAIIPAKSGEYPTIEYQGHRCVAYMEEYSKYKSADSFDPKAISMNTIMHDAFVMTAKVAAKKWDFSELQQELFCSARIPRSTRFHGKYFGAQKKAMRLKKAHKYDKIAS